MRIGIFGGAFNPPHNGHIQIVNQALKQLALDKLIVLPTGQPPHKEYFDKAKRLCMAQLCFRNINKVEVSDYELQQCEFSYSYKTLQYFKGIYPNDDLIFIIGGDSLRDFDTWRNPEEILKLASVCCVKRAGVEFDDNVDKIEKEFNVKLLLLDIEPDDVSSTNLRVAVDFGLDISQYVATDVKQFILENSLYKNHGDFILKLRKMLNEKRFLHTFYVCIEGLKLNSILKINSDDVFIACLLHDCAKYVKADEYAKYNFVNEQNFPEPVVHSFLGSLVAQKDFNITNRDILNAIKFHTTGRAGMSQLEKLVYVADTIEQSRPDTVDYVRKIIYNNFEKGFYLCALYNFEYAKKNHNKICDLTEECLQYYKQEIN